MVVLYLFARSLFAFVHLLVRWRVARLEKRYAHLAADADKLLKQSCVRAGNSNRPDPFLAAKQQLYKSRRDDYGHQQQQQQRHSTTAVRESASVSIANASPSRPPAPPNPCMCVVIGGLVV